MLLEYIFKQLARQMNNVAKYGLFATLKKAAFTWNFF